MKILMVCLGNICRSPLAEGILKAKLPANFVVDSAGTGDWHQGEQPDVRSMETAKAHGLDISGQRSRPIKESDFEDFDLIFCMDQSNLRNVKALAKNETQLEKVSLILNILNDPNRLEVPDPYYGGKDGFEKVYQLLDEACSLHAQQLLK